MPKRYKIKRYHGIYTSRGASPAKMVLLVVAVAALVFVGVSLYAPVRDFFSGQLSARMEARHAKEESQQGEEVPSAGDASSVAQSEAPVPEQAAAPSLAQCRALLIPPAQVSGGNPVQFVQDTGLPDINTVVIDLKDAGGVVRYRSNLEMAVAAGALPENAVDLGTTVQTLKAAGYSVIGRIYAYQDPIGYLGNDMAAVKYMNSRWTWLDDSVENGGKSWLNPYSPIAQSYVTDIALEALGAGVDTILLDGLQFPEGLGLEMATYGESTAGKGKDAALSEYVAHLQQQVADRGGNLICAVSARDLLTNSFDKYGGANPAALFGNTLAVHAEPARLGPSFESERLTIQSPATQPYEAVGQTLSATLPLLGEGKTVFPLIQGYTDSSLEAQYNKQYAAQDVLDQVRAVNESGLDSYMILY